MKKMDAMIISTGRAASTAIYKYLDIAGHLNLPNNKEPHFWCDFDQYSGIYEGLKSIHVTDESSYVGLYVSSKIFLDASVGYFFCLEDVIKKMKNANQNPRVIFLYREPVSRAASLFNELKKKGLTQSENVFVDIQREKEVGMWWEYYYDNVRYADVFSIMKNYFNDILAVNYDYFSRNQVKVVNELLAFLSLNINDNSKLDFSPVNSSAEAIALSKISEMRRIRKIGKFFPFSLRKKIANILAKVVTRPIEGDTSNLEKYLPVSMAQYQSFRELIGHEDLLCLKK